MFQLTVLSLPVDHSTSLFDIDDCHRQPVNYRHHSNDWLKHVRHFHLELKLNLTQPDWSGLCHDRWLVQRPKHGS